MTEQWQQAQVRRVSTAIRELRGNRSAQWLSSQTAALGVPVNRSLITDMETGRRKYVAVHELTVIAAALGVTPATLLTWGTVPDGTVELLPGRFVDGLTAARWWGGETLPRSIPAAQGLSHDDRTDELFTTARRREQLHVSMIGYGSPKRDGVADPALSKKMRNLLKGTVRRIRELGGVIADDEHVDG